MQRDLKRTVDNLFKTKEENEALVHENSAGLELMKKLMADKTEFEDKYNNICKEAKKLAEDLDQARR